MAGHQLLIGKGTDALGSDLSIHGSVAIDYELITTKEVTLADHSYVMVDTGLAAGNVTVRLPAAELHPRRIYSIKKVSDDHSVNLLPPPSDKIEGESGMVIPQGERGGVTVLSDGLSRWHVLSQLGKLEVLGREAYVVHHITSVTPELVAWFRCEEKEGADVYGIIAEERGLSIDGADHITGATGVLGGGIDFDGTVALVNDREPHIDFSGNLTVMASIKPGGTGRRPIFALINWGAGSHCLSLSSSHHLSHRYKRGAVQHDETLVTPEKAEVGHWTNVAITISGEVVQFYHDGVMIHDYEMDEAVPPFDSQALYVGRDNGTKRFVGTMDEVMFFDEALDPAEIKSLRELMQP